MDHSLFSTQPSSSFNHPSSSSSYSFHQEVKNGIKFMKRVILEDNEEIEYLRQRLRHRPLEFDSCHHNQMDSRMHQEPHHYHRTNYCNDPFFRDDFNFNPSLPPLGNHGSYQESPMSCESMMSIMKEFMDMRKLFFEHRKEFKRVRDNLYRAMSSDQQRYEEERYALHIDTFQIPDEHILDSNDHLIEDENICLQNLICNHSLDDNKIENHPLEDTFDLGLKEFFEENQNIFEDIPHITLDKPSLGIDLVSSSFHMLHESALQIPLLEPWVVDCEPIHSEPNFYSIFDSDFLDADEPPPRFFDLAVFQFFRSAGITLHHQLVSLTRLSVGRPVLHSFSISWVCLNTMCELDSLLVLSHL